MSQSKVLVSSKSVVEGESLKTAHDLAIPCRRDRLASADPHIEIRIAVFDQRFVFIEQCVVQPLKMTIGKFAQQQVGFFRARVAAAIDQPPDPGVSIFVGHGSAFAHY